MGIAIELRNAIGHIRRHLAHTAELNGVEPFVVEGWLVAVEDHLNRVPVDWAAIRVCLNVLGRWIGRVEELSVVVEMFKKVSSGGDQINVQTGLPSEFEDWLWSPWPAAPKDLDLAGAGNERGAIREFPRAVPR
jgi:hypothetical protein